MNENKSPLEGADVQIAVLLAGIAAGIIAIVTVKEIEEQRSLKYPCKDYSYIQNMAKAGTCINLGAAIYFTWLAWVYRERNPGGSSFEWLFTAASLGVLSAVIKTWQAFKIAPGDTQTAQTQTEEEVE